MSCGGGCCQRKNYNSDKPLSKRIGEVVLVFFVVWLIGFGFLAQAFNQPTIKPKNKRRNKKRGYKEPGFFEKLENGLRRGDLLIWGLVIFIIFSLILLVIKTVKNQIRKTEEFIQNKWDEAMAQQEQRYHERMNNYQDMDDDDYDGPRIRELETEEEEAHWRSLMEKEKRERERQMAEAEEEKKVR